MELSGVCKDTDLSGILALDDVLKFPVHRLLIALISIGINGLGIAEAIHYKVYIYLFQGLLYIDSLTGLHDLRASLCTISLLKSQQLPADDLGHRTPVLQDILIAIDIGHRLLVLFDQGLQLETDQLIKTHIQNGIGLGLCELQLGCHHGGLRGLKADPLCFSFHHAGFGLGAVLGAPEDLDDQIDDIAGLDQAFLDLSAALFLFK